MLAHRPCRAPEPNPDKGPVVANIVPAPVEKAIADPAARPVLREPSRHGPVRKPNDSLLHRPRRRLRGVLAGRHQDPDGRGPLPPRLGSGHGRPLHAPHQVGLPVGRPAKTGRSTALSAAPPQVQLGQAAGFPLRPLMRPSGGAGTRPPVGPHRSHRRHHRRLVGYSAIARLNDHDKSV